MNEIFLYSGASLIIRDNEGKTALGLALQKGYTNMVEALREAGDYKFQCNVRLLTINK